MTKVGSGAAQKGKNRWGPYFSQIPGGQGEADCKSGESCLWGWWLGRDVVLTATPTLPHHMAPTQSGEEYYVKSPRGLDPTPLRPWRKLEQLFWELPSPRPSLINGLSD